MTGAISRRSPICLECQQNRDRERSATLEYTGMVWTGSDDSGDRMMCQSGLRWPWGSGRNSYSTMEGELWGVKLWKDGCDTLVALALPPMGKEDSGPHQQQVQFIDALHQNSKSHKIFMELTKCFCGWIISFQWALTLTVLQWPKF